MQPGETFAFTMCNPPFFESADEAGRNPRTAFGGSPQEMVTPGGEAAFVRQMVHDSLKLKVLLEGMRHLSLIRALTGPAKRPCCTAPALLPLCIGPLVPASLPSTRPVSTRRPSR